MQRDRDQSSDPYAVLGVPPTATADEITRAYRRALRAHHPDLRVAPAGSDADETLHAVLAAYALLRDPRRRAVYDRATGGTGKRSARRAGPTRARVTGVDGGDDGPPLWAGPVRWHRNG